MASNNEFIVRFMTGSFEKSINYYLLSDKNYVVPGDKMHEYIRRALSIPYIEYISSVRSNQGVITNDQLTQSSIFAACSTEMCKALEKQGNPGMNYLDIGRLFPQYVKAKNEGAYRKYGENQIKTAAQLGLAFEYYGYWYLSCIGYVYNELEVRQQKSLLARTILRIPLYQIILIELLEGDVDITDYMPSLSNSTKGRRSGSILKMINLCLDECRKERIHYCDLFYPIYNVRSKTLVKARQEGTIGIEFTKKNQLENQTVIPYMKQEAGTDWLEAAESNPFGI